MLPKCAIGNFGQYFIRVQVSACQSTAIAGFGEKRVSHFDLKSDKFSIPWESKHLDSANQNKVLFHEFFELVHVDVARHFCRNDYSQVTVFCGT